MPSHFGSGYLPEPGRLFLALQRLTLFDVRARAVEARLFVVPENEANRAIGLHVRAAEDARELHDDRGAGAVVVRGFAPADAVHVAADDVHLFRVRACRPSCSRPPARSTVRRRLLGVERAKLRVGLL